MRAVALRHDVMILICRAASVRNGARFPSVLGNGDFGAGLAASLRVPALLIGATLFAVAAIL